jgi:hypothetical protein
MEIISFFIGIMFGVIMKDLIRIIKAILSFGTTYLVLKLCHPNMILLPISEWTWNNLFYGYNFWFLGISSFLASLGIFYFILPFWFSNLINSKLMSKFNTIYKTLSKIDKMRSLVGFRQNIKKIVLFMIKFGLIKRHPQPNIKLELYYDEYRDDLSSFISLIIHLMICWLFIRPIQSVSFLIIIALILLIGIFMFLFSPIIYYFSDSINKIFEDELNRNIKQLPD